MLAHHERGYPLCNDYFSLGGALLREYLQAGREVTKYFSSVDMQFFTFIFFFSVCACSIGLVAIINDLGIWFSILCLCNR